MKENEMNLIVGMFLYTWGIIIILSDKLDLYYGLLAIMLAILGYLQTKNYSKKENKKGK